MINDKKILAIIPARGGSKGILRKNIKLLDGKPLVAYTIEAAKESKYIDRLIVSTDDEEIAQISRDYGADVPFLRPSELSTDIARAIGVVKHALEFMEVSNNCIFEIIVYLEPPAPLKITEDIDNAIELFAKESPDSVVSVNEANQYHPILMKKIVNNRLECFCFEEPEGMPRQLYEPKAYMRNGAVYVLNRRNIINNIFYGKEIMPYIMPLERSICIDDMMDWLIAEAWIKHNINSK